MSYFHPYPHCWANLDPGERCDCTLPAKSQAFGILDKKTARSADTTTDGQETQQDS